MHPQKLNPGIRKLIQSLAVKYKLGLAGNQPSAVKNLLEKYDILRFFTTTEVSEDLGISKPDLKFFKNILNRLDVRAEEAVMIGDRLDNDIIPAKKLGMKAILVKVGLFAVLEPREPSENPDATISSTTLRIRESCNGGGFDGNFSRRSGGERRPPDVPAVSLLASDDRNRGGEGDCPEAGSLVAAGDCRATGYALCQGGEG